ncbi:MAG: pyridoxal-dependent decarboxylase [Deltaproteobacteria bacterium]|nr:pyridoxal-dependent decarboxylase [Deltaproteobacteria bacterium]
MLPARTLISIPDSRPPLKPLPPQVPSTAFASPDGANRQAVERLLGQVLARVTGAMAGAGERAPYPAGVRLPPGDDLPEEGSGEDALLAGVEAALAGSMNPAHPGYIGHMDPLPSVASVAGGLVSASLNNNMLSLELSPFFSRLEQRVMERLAGLFGLPPGSGGLLVSGGTLANLQAMTVARNHHFPVMADGLWGLPRRPVVLASRAAHTSLQKAAMILGLGSGAVRPLEGDSDGPLTEETMAQALADARAQGLAPFMVVVTAGTTVTGSIEPLRAAGRLARDNGLWFHVDGALGGTLMFSSRYRERLAGIELADSMTFNPQKWLYVTKVCATVMFRDMSLLHRAFRVQLPYMLQPPDFVNYGEISVQGTRHPDVLKLWLTLRHLGRRGLEALVDRCMDTAAQMAEEVSRRPELTLAMPPQMNIVVFRAQPKWVAPDQWDDLNLQLQKHLLDGGVYLAVSVYQGKKWLRGVVLNPYTGEEELTRLWAGVDGFLAESKIAAGG